MGQPKLRPDAASAGGKNSAEVLENPEPIAQRFAYSRNLRHALTRVGGAPPSRPAERAATPAAARAGVASLRTDRPSRTSLLVAGLSFAAVVPTFILAVWLGPLGTTSPEPSAPTQKASAPAPSAVLTVAERIEAVGGSPVGFPIALDGTDGVPPRSVIAIKGLPQGSNLSEGRPYGDSEWTLTPDQIGDLNLVLPANANGEFKLSIALIAPDDRIVAATQMLLVVAAAPPAPATLEAVSGAVSPEGEGPAEAALAPEGDAPIAAVHDQQAMEASPSAVDESAADGGTVPQEEAPASMETAVAPSNDGPPNISEPADTGATQLGTVQPSVFVNMREEPSSSSPVLGVIAKGADLPVLDRKRGWVQVAHPETGKQGWIYSGLLVGEAKPNQRVRRIAPAEAEAQSESFWGRVGRWLSPSPEQSNAN
jgi:uncharacterized protein YgiM (DUF1202 family)